MGKLFHWDRELGASKPRGKSIPGMKGGTSGLVGSWNT